jgi:hypothetical protein
VFPMQVSTGSPAQSASLAVVWLGVALAH